MNRKNGYLKLNKILRKEEIPVFSTKAITKIGAYYNHYIKIEDQKFFVKNDDGWEQELICCEFLKKLGIDTVEYDIALINDEKYIISLDYRKKDYKYISGSEIIDGFYNNVKKIDQSYFLNFNIKPDEVIEKVRYDLNNLENIWQALTLWYKDNPEQESIVANLMEELEKRFLIRSILLMDSDYHPDNWCIEEGKNINLVPNYDFGSTLNGATFFGMPFGVFVEDAGDSNKIQLKNYLSNTVEENIEEFIKIFNQATPGLFINAIKDVEKKLGIMLDNKDKFINNYTNNYNELKDIITNYRGKHGR